MSGIEVASGELMTVGVIGICARCGENLTGGHQCPPHFTRRTANRIVDSLTLSEVETVVITKGGAGCCVHWHPHPVTPNAKVLRLENPGPGVMEVEIRPHAAPRPPAPEYVTTGVANPPLPEGSKCAGCDHRSVFSDGKGAVLNLCTASPYEEDDFSGAVTWLDVSTFASEHCLEFKPKGPAGREASAAPRELPKLSILARVYCSVAAVFDTVVALIRHRGDLDAAFAGVEKQLNGLKAKARKLGVALDD